MDRAPPVDLRQPIPRGHRREHRLHDPNRRHGPDRYELYRAEADPESDAEGESEDDADQPGGAHPQYYQPHWKCENDRWIWLRPHPINRTLARCTVCHRTLSATITVIAGHEQIDDHIYAMLKIKVPIDEYDPHLTREEFEDEKARIKLKIATWFGDQSVPFIKIDTLLPLIKKIARFPGVLNSVKLNRIALSKIIRNVVAPCHKQELAKILRDQKFATLFDESTGISKDKSGCLLIRFADHCSYRMRTTIWDLIPIYREDDEHSDATAESLYNLTINSLFGQRLARQEDRPVLRRENYIAAGSDGCNTMIGVRNSVRQRLMLLQDIYNWFLSAKRLHALQQHQIELNLDLHRILRFVEFRWLTGLPTLHRVSEQLMAIEATLADAPNNAQAVQLLRRLRSPIVQCYIAFLSFILEVPEDFNGWMQTEEVIFPEVFNRICEDFRDILLCYMEEKYVNNENNENLLDIDIEDDNHFLEDNNMRIGNEARAQTEELPEQDYVNVMRTIRKFLIYLATEWFERLVLPWARFQCSECLLVENALSQQYHLANPNVIRQLAEQFPRAITDGVDVELLEMQWDQLVQNEVNLQLPPEATTDYFWFVVRSINDGEGNHPYLQLADFALNVLITPHSNAQPERIWSIEKYIKNKWRNKLHLSSVKAVLLIKLMLEWRGCSKKVHLFEPSAEMIRRVRLRLYDVDQALFEDAARGNE